MLIARIAVTAFAAVLTCCFLHCGVPSGADAAVDNFQVVQDRLSGLSSVYGEVRRVAPPVRSGPAKALWSLELNQVKPLSLVAADFNSDGMPDAVIGYGDDNGGWVAELRCGNPDSLYPNSLEALKRKAEKKFSDEPFHAGSVLMPLPVKPAFMAAGDFNGDGMQDLAVGSEGKCFFFVLPGDGKGRFEKPRRIDLKGPLTFLCAGDINRRDGLPELIAGVNGADGPGLVVFEDPTGALGATPEVIGLPGEAVEVVFGNFDEDYPWDMAVLLASGEVAVVHGRDRQLSFEAGRRAVVPDSAPVLLPLSHSAALAAGDFLGTGRDVLASLSPDGSLSFVDPRQPSAPLPTKSVAGTADRNLAKASKSRLMTMAAAGADQLVIFGDGRTSLAVAAGSARTKAAAGSIALDAPAVAVLPARLNADAFTDMLVLGDDPINPLSVVRTGAGRVFVVNSTGCGPDADQGDGVCADQDGKCTLPAAIAEIAGHSGTGTGTVRFNIPGGGVPSTCGYFNSSPGIVYDGTSQPGGFVHIPGYVVFKANTVLQGIIFDDAEVGDNSKVEGCKWGNELTLASNCTVGGTIASARNNVLLQGGVAGLLIQGNGNLVQGNWFGYNPDGPSPNIEAIRIDTPYGQTTGPANNVIGGTIAGARNVIVGAGTNAAVQIDPGTSGNRFQGNYLGTDPSGIQAAGSSEAASGIRLGGIGNTVGGAVAAARNLIVGAGNGKYGYGIEVVGPPTSTQGLVIQGNYIGLNKTGATRIGTWPRGVHISSESERITVGGAVSGAGNVIAGSSFCGVIIQGKDEKTGVQGTNRANVIQGNYIGTDKTGTVAIPNNYGVLITYSPDNLVGGTTAGARNIISGNSADGIHVLGETAGHNIIKGNYIGVDATGMKKLPQPGWGVFIESSAYNTIGGLTPAARNVISCNGQGNVRLQNAAAIGNKVQGNYLGPAVNGVTNPGAEGYWGVMVSGGASKNTIGGTQKGAGNIIAYNTQTGVVATSDGSVDNAILGNSIHSIDKMGIDLGYNGVTPNDYQDADVGPNNLQNAPEITSIETATGYAVNGKLHSKPSTKYRLEFFANCSLNADGMTEGKELLGARSVTTSSVGDALFSYTFPTPKCPMITATATDPAGNTSEYSLWVAQTTPIFKDQFSSTAQWKVVSGSWSMAASTYVSGPGTRNVTIVKAIDPVTSPIGASRIQTSIKLAQGESSPNGGLIFGYKSPTEYRWLRLEQGKVTLGQTGIIDGTPPGKLASANVAINPGKLYAVRLDVFNDGKVNVYINNKKVLSGTFKNGAAGGGVGLLADKSKATFDNFTVWAPSVLPGN